MLTFLRFFQGTARIKETLESNTTQGFIPEHESNTDILNFQTINSHVVVGIRVTDRD